MSCKKHIKITSASLLLQCIFLSSCVDMDYFTSDSRPIRLEAASQSDATRAATDIQSDCFAEGEVVNVFISGKSNDFEEYVIGAPLQFKAEAVYDGKNALTSLGDTPYFPTGTGSEAYIYATYPETVIANG